LRLSFDETKSEPKNSGRQSSKTLQSILLSREEKSREIQRSGNKYRFESLSQGIPEKDLDKREKPPND
jgi:hypothetical protein